MNRIDLKNMRRTQQGFTLIELLVAIFGFTLIAYGLIALVSNIFTAAGGQTSLVAESDQARKVGSRIMGELRNAQSGSNGAYALDTAENQQLIFYSNVNSDSYTERIRYFAQNGKLWRGITLFNGTTYNTSTEASIVVQNNLANGSNPLFYYYNSSYTGSTTQASLSPPINVTVVTLVKLNLQIYNKAGVKNINTYTITTSGSIRNLKTNLGS